ncbi:MAG: cupin 2 conserved barrel domain protein [Armatimonadetes bacterium CSP1-3]|nr:MAG: cupin 2 conserved barrel domain protein [Armatimonadetes bacterium CSP1-3]
MTQVGITRVDRGRAHPPANPEYFQGTVHMQELYQPDRDGEESELIAVFFEIGARTRPHTHDSTQVLQVLSGRCVVVTETERRIVEAGEFAVVSRGIWHWHGATVEGPMCHISIKLPGRTHWDAPLRDWEAG